jgi:transcriptional regulator with XRE-family HTH domain
MNILRLKEILKEKKITGKELAKNVEVTEASISNIVKGNSFPKPDLLKKIAKVLKVDIKDLFNSTLDEELNGFVEYKGTTYRIRNFEDLEKLLAEKD